MYSLQILCIANKTFSKLLGLHLVRMFWGVAILKKSCFDLFVASVVRVHDLIKSLREPSFFLSVCLFSCDPAVSSSSKLPLSSKKQRKVLKRFKKGSKKESSSNIMGMKAPFPSWRLPSCLVSQLGGEEQTKRSSVCEWHDVYYCCWFSRFHTTHSCWVNKSDLCLIKITDNPPLRKKGSTLRIILTNH